MKRKIISGAVIGAAILIYAVASCRGWVSEYASNIFARGASIFCLTMAYIESAHAATKMSMEDEVVIFTQSELINILLCLVFCLLENTAIIIAILLIIASGNLLTFRDFLIVIVICCSTDFGAGVFGYLFGKHNPKFLSRISPNKTIEGFIFGMLFSSLMSIIIVPTLGGYSMFGTLKLVAIMSPLAIAGDLLASLAKRCYRMKDSGEKLSLIPVFRILEWPLKYHGGYLDRMDSITFGILCITLFKSQM
ncbi:MAG: phosphatidate cytidylyltransferase [Candidatus Saccharibacteria bacterium]|nr:phosphatidate cytidylyltransferase [Candidatus Saccharibacteria bacterium]